MKIHVYLARVGCVCMNECPAPCAAQVRHADNAGLPSFFLLSLITGESQAKVEANTALMDYAVGTINTYVPLAHRVVFARWKD